MIKKNRGITIITLVITIIILLILAGISIASLVGNEGLINKAKKAKSDYENAQEDELAMLDGYGNFIDSGNIKNTGSTEQNTGEVEVTKLVSQMEEMKKQIEELKSTTTTATTIDKVYPIGSIYMSVNQTNPSELFGGTWEVWGSGRVPVGVNTADGDFNTVEKTGGEKTHILTVNEMPVHRHTFTAEGTTRYQAVMDVGLDNNAWGVHFETQEGFRAAVAEMNNAGGNYPHNNLQPYITCYMWKRVS